MQHLAFPSCYLLNREKKPAYQLVGVVVEFTRESVVVSKGNNWILGVKGSSMD